jgi:ABC-2 type transport system permease protein
VTAATLSARRRAATQIRAVVRKEVLQTLRDRRMMFMLVGAPLLQTIIFGFAVDFDVDRVPTVVADQDRSAASREQLRRVLADGTLRHVGSTAGGSEAERWLEQGDAAVALIIPPRFQADLLAERPAEVQVVVDGTDPNRSLVAAAAATRYFAEASAALVRERLARRGLPPPPTVSLAHRVWYNPRLQSAVFMVPGVLSMLLLITTTIVTAMGLAREREMGTLEQVLVTPIRPLYLLIGKMAPYFAVGLFNVLLVLALGTWVFEIPVRGSLAIVAAGSALYLLTTLGMGLLISTLSHTQQQAFLGGFLFTLPALLLSGVMTPIRSMPPWLQAVTYLNPLRYFTEVMRANLLKGAGLAELWPQLLSLLLLGLGILAGSTLRFRKRLS